MLRLQGEVRKVTGGDVAKKLQVNIKFTMFSEEGGKRGL